MNPGSDVLVGAISYALALCPLGSVPAFLLEKPNTSIAIVFLPWRS